MKKITVLILVASMFSNRLAHATSTPTPEAVFLETASGLQGNNSKSAEDKKRFHDEMVKAVDTYKAAPKEGLEGTPAQRLDAAAENMGIDLKSPKAEAQNLDTNIAKADTDAGISSIMDQLDSSKVPNGNHFSAVALGVSVAVGAAVVLFYVYVIANDPW